MNLSGEDPPVTVSIAGETFQQMKICLVNPPDLLLLLRSGCEEEARSVLRSFTHSLTRSVCL